MSKLTAREFARTLQTERCFFPTYEEEERNRNRTEDAAAEDVLHWMMSANDTLKRMQPFLMVGEKHCRCVASAVEQALRLCIGRTVGRKQQSVRIRGARVDPDSLKTAAVCRPSALRFNVDLDKDVENHTCQFTYVISASFLQQDDQVWAHVRKAYASQMLLGLNARVGRNSSLLRFLRHVLCERFVLLHVFEFAGFRLTPDM